jgi:hypothetical protein
VRLAVEFDDQAVAAAGKVRDVRADGMLVDEAMTAQSVVLHL